MKRPRIKPVHNKSVRVKGKKIGSYSVSSSGRATLHTKLPKF